MFTESHLMRKIGDILSIPAEFCISGDSCPETNLTDDEKLRLQGFTHFGRRFDWLRGRAALKGLLRKWGLSEDTSVLHFPNPALSLTHSGGLAIAGGVQKGVGFGLDFEAERNMRPETARFFLNASERERIDTGVSRHLLRLWTIKEALFKADLNNAGKVLRDYKLRDATLLSGEAVGSGQPGEETVFRYASLEWDTGFLTVAVPASFRQASA